MSAIGQTGTIAPTPSGDPSGQPSTSPPSTGQATTDPTQQGANEGFWGRFPNVPLEQRAALEPHLKTVQGYLTRMEQTYVAPLRQAGIKPAEVKGLANFAKNFNEQPLQTFLGIAQMLQQNGVIHEDLDLQALAAVVQGQDPPDDEEEVEVDDPDDPWAGAPPWALELRAKEQQREQQQQEQQRSEAQRREDQVLDASVKSVKDKLVAAGFDEAHLSDKDITARFIVHNGSAEAVIRELTGLRSGLLQGVIKTENNGNDPVELPRGVPPTGKTSLQRRAEADKKDSFKNASAGAEQYLRTALKNAQG